jgi:vacuolar-type H+-ATPase subunit I/STV1
MKEVLPSEIKDLIQDLKNSLEIRKDTINKLYNDLALKDAVIAELKNQISLTQLQLHQAQEEIKDELELRHLQLLQVQEELSASLAYRNYMEKWKKEVAYSFKGQFRLFTRTFLYRVLDWSRWHVPIRMIRPFQKKLSRMSNREI